MRAAGVDRTVVIEAPGGVGPARAERLEDKGRQHQAVCPEKHSPLRVLVCGGRDFTDRARLFREMDRIKATESIGLLIHGAARGADSMAGEWAKMRRVEVRAFPAEWERLGRKAGPVRNQQMLDEGKPDLVVAFPGGHGTADMVRRAQGAGLRVVRAA